MLKDLSRQDHSSETTVRADDWTPRITAVLNRIVYAIAKHWLLLVNAIVSLYAGLPVLAPLLMATGHPSAAQVIYTIFRPLCHQLPERSFFLFGLRFTYTLDELEHLLGPAVPLRYIGNLALGYKIAVCERDIATFLATLLGGVIFALIRRRLRPASLRAFALLCIPMAVDGLGQLLHLWESTWWSRVTTGALFGIACVWLAYPYVEKGMRDVLEALSSELPSR